MKDACRCGHLELVKYLMEVGADTGAEDLLHQACNTGYYNLTLIEYLAEENPMSIQYKDAQGRTPIFNVCANSHLSILKYLIEEGADPQVRDIRGQGLLHVACKNVQIEVIEALLSTFALDPNVEDNGGNTSLHALAKGAKTFCRNDNNRDGETDLIEATKLLLRYKANPTKRNTSEKQPIDFLSVKLMPRFYGFLNTETNNCPSFE